MSTEDAQAKLSNFKADRARKVAESNAKSIENRIRYFQREEERLWRDVEEVRRQATIREKGKAREAERREASQAIQEIREQHLEEKRSRANQTKKMLEEASQRVHEAPFIQQRVIAGQDQRRMSAEVMHQKKLSEKQLAIRNTERALSIQRSQLQARIKTAQQKAERIQALRVEAERQRVAKERGVHEVESQLSALEAEEMVCIQRLQHSRVVAQSELEGLELSFGPRSSIASALRARQARPSMELLDESAISLGLQDTSMHCHGVQEVHEEPTLVNGIDVDFRQDTSP